MIAVVSWQPSEEERARIASGEPIFITMCGGLAPHYPSLDFHSATNPA